METTPPSPKNISYGDLISKENQERLMVLRELDTNSRFLIGQIANDIYNHPPVLPYAITRELVYRAVGFWCGKTARTVRYYAETEAQVPKELRDKYDTLAYAHYAFVARPEYRDRMEEVLDFAAEHNLSPDALETALSVRRVSGQPYTSPQAVGYYNAPTPASHSGNPGAIYYDDVEELYSGFLRAVLTRMPREIDPRHSERLQRAFTELKELFEELGWINPEKERKKEPVKV